MIEKAIKKNPTIKKAHSIKFAQVLGETIEVAFKIVSPISLALLISLLGLSI